MCYDMCQCVHVVMTLTHDKLIVAWTPGMNSTAT